MRQLENVNDDEAFRASLQQRRLRRKRILLIRGRGLFRKPPHAARRKWKVEMRNVDLTCLLARTTRATTTTTTTFAALNRFRKRESDASSSDYSNVISPSSSFAGSTAVTRPPPPPPPAWIIESWVSPSSSTLSQIDFLLLPLQNRRGSSSSSRPSTLSLKRSSDAPVTLQGWLFKQGSEGLMLWKKRWFVLSEFCLFYYRGGHYYSIRILFR